MNYGKCDEKLGVMLDRFGAETAIFLFFKDGTAYFDPKVSKAGELRDNRYIRSLHCIWKRKSRIAGWRGWELGVDTPFDSRAYRRLDEDEQLRLLSQLSFAKSTVRYVEQIADAGDSGLVDDLASAMKAVQARLKEADEHTGLPGLRQDRN